MRVTQEGSLAERPIWMWIVPTFSRRMRETPVCEGPRESDVVRSRVSPIEFPVFVLCCPARPARPGVESRLVVSVPGGCGPPEPCG